MEDEEEKGMTVSEAELSTPMPQIYSPDPLCLSFQA